ncbi:reverse transcriptase domain-containing protein [Tanacetum coccineum]
MDTCDQVHSEGMSLRTTVMTQQSEIVELRAADQRRQTVISELLKADYRRQRQLVETLKIVKSLKAQMTELQRQQGPAKDPAEPELPEEAEKWPKRMAHKNRESRQSPQLPHQFTTTPPPHVQQTRKWRRKPYLKNLVQERNERTCGSGTYQDFMNMDNPYASGYKKVVNLTPIGLERMETVFRRSNCTVENQDIELMMFSYAMTWSDLKKMMTTKYCPRNEIKKIEAELWNLKVQGTDVVAYNQRFQELALLSDRMFPEEADKIERYVGGMPDPIYSSVVASKPKTMQEAIEMATGLMDRRINTLAENKRKLEDTPRNNQTYQQNKRQNTGQGLCTRNGRQDNRMMGLNLVVPSGTSTINEQPAAQWKTKNLGKCSGVSQGYAVERRAKPNNNL